MKKVLVTDGNKQNYELRAIRKVALEAGWEVAKIYSYNKDFKELKAMEDCQFFTYGTIAFTDLVDQELGLNLADVPMWSLMDEMPSFLTRRNCGCDSIKNIAQRLENESLFVKPVREKEFEARVYIGPKELPDYLSANSLAIWSDPVTYEMEVRSFVLNGKRLDSSPYMVDMEPIEIIEPDDTYWDKAEFAISNSRNFPFGHFFEMVDGLNTFFDMWEIFEPCKGLDLPSTYVLDLGYREGRWEVIEFNNAHSSGLYDCDPVDVLKCIEASPQPKKERFDRGGYLW